jgi:hypothetical protein
MGLNLLNGGLGAITGLLTTGNPIGAIAGGVEGALQGGGPSGLGNLGPQTDPTLPAQQALDQWAEWDQFALNLENVRHNSAMQWQSTMFNELQDEKTEQMREMNVMREVAMKQREADNAILKEFIRTIKD